MALAIFLLLIFDMFRNVFMLRIEFYAVCTTTKMETIFFF